MPASSIGKKRRKVKDDLEEVNPKEEKPKKVSKMSIKKIKKIDNKNEQNNEERMLNETLRLYSVLLSTFSSRDHLIIGRDKEEK